MAAFADYFAEVWSTDLSSLNESIVGRFWGRRPRKCAARQKTTTPKAAETGLAPRVVRTVDATDPQ
jgi:hypothetical protein